MSLQEKAVKKQQPYAQWQCLLVFILLLVSFFCMLAILPPRQRVFLQAILLTSGWIIWTFLEYMIHRFWMHHKHEHVNEVSFTRHTHHHQHPTEIRITSLQRFALLIACACLIGGSFWWTSYVMVLAGVFSGFVLYCFMHVWLHQRWSQKIFTQLHRYHIHHHCKHPDKCFGISVTWWDRLFKTAPPGDANISPRIIEFYFGNNDRALKTNTQK